MNTDNFYLATDLLLKISEQIELRDDITTVTSMFYYSFTTAVSKVKSVANGDDLIGNVLVLCYQLSLYANGNIGNTELKTRLLNIAKHYNDRTIINFMEMKGF